jgi:hypothetical protein
MEHNVDLLIRVRDEASKKLGLFADNMTEFQRRIVGNIASRQAGMGGDETSLLKKQFEERFNLEDRLYRASHNSQQVALRDTEEYFSQLRVKWQNNQSMLTLIDRTESAERKKIMADYTESSKSQMQRFVGSLAGKGTMYGVIAFAAAQAIDTITNAHKRFRESDQEWRDYVNVIAESIPIFGRVSRSVRELTTELSGLAEAQERAARVDKYLDTLTGLQDKFKLNADLRNAPNDKERDKIRALQEYKQALKEIEDLEKQAADIAKKNEERLNSYHPWWKNVTLDAVPKVPGSLRTNAEAEYQAKIAEIDAKPVQDITASLQEQIDTWGMNAGQIAYYKAELAGATSQELAHIQALTWKLQALEDEKEKVEELEKAQKKKDAEEAAAAKKRLAEIDSFTERVKKMIQTPKEEFAEVQQKLMELLMLGKITQEEFNKAKTKFAKDIFGEKDVKDHGYAWSPFESRLMTSAPAGRVDPGIEIAKDQKNIQQKIVVGITKTNQILEQMQTKDSGVLQFANFN